MRQVIKKILVIFFLLSVVFLFFLFYKIPQIIYEYNFDYNNFESDTGGIIIYKKSGKNSIHYDSINSETFYKEIETKNLTWEIVNASLTRENIGPVVDNKYISGNFIDPGTGTQIGYWKYDISQKSLQIIKNY